MEYALRTPAKPDPQCGVCPDVSRVDEVVDNRLSQGDLRKIRLRGRCWEAPDRRRRAA